MLPDVAVPSYDQAYGSLGNVYDPQTSQVNSEIAQLAPQQQAQQDSLDQAKVNAFKDITSSANAKGMLFSGFTPAEQGVYTGTKYLPAVANLKTSFNNSKNTLLDKINQINAQRATQAQGIVSSANSQAANNAYRNAQLAIAQQRANASSARSSAPSAAAIKQQDMATTAQNLQSKVGKDGHVSQTTWNKAMSDWIGAGYNAKDFVNSNMQFINQRYGGYHGYS